MNAKVVYSRDIAPIDLGAGASRKVLAYSDDMMIVEVHFEAGASAAVHTHPHVQSTYIREGRFQFTIEGETVEVASGDTLAFPSNVPHGLTCLETGTLLDIFTPMRKDFV